LCGLARNGKSEIAESELEAQVRAEAQSLGDKGLTLACISHQVATATAHLRTLAPPPADRVQVHPWQFFSNELESFLDAAETS
jgi:hypothetical protein